MQDYHIYSHYVEEQNEPKTSVKYEKAPSKVDVQKATPTNETKAPIHFNSKAAAGVTLASANKINSYVGEYTERRVTQRKVNLGLTFAGLGLYAITNPAAALGATAMFLGNATINYQIKVYKENLSADYLRQLSGGTVKTGR